MATITPEEAKRLAQLWGAYPDRRAVVNRLLTDYLSQLDDATEIEMERVYLVEIAAQFTNADELAEDRRARLQARSAT